MGIQSWRVSFILAAVPSSRIWSPKYYSDFEFSIIISPMFNGLTSASFIRVVLDFGGAIMTYMDFDIFVRYCFESSICPTSIEPFFASSSVKFIFAISSRKIRLVSSILPILAVTSPLVISFTAVPIFMQELLLSYLVHLLWLHYLFPLLVSILIFYYLI